MDSAARRASRGFFRRQVSLHGFATEFHRVHRIQRLAVEPVEFLGFGMRRIGLLQSLQVGFGKRRNGGFRRRLDVRVPAPQFAEMLEHVWLPPDGVRSSRGEV